MELPYWARTLLVAIGVIAGSIVVGLTILLGWWYLSFSYGGATFG